ncbi:response regulator transcription factor [Amycolatopsis acidiphila]|uniref:Response regulator transcription factor n=1 Tax=Amycolatopsis acidiphila TaxID=715473 RepID=A0A558ALC1_9PSEU|nr:response regulator transcription factor [Amycolatopsis acidiphila]TVT25066.1 response regulator transcription factor [Amycolatopsis acidiphila]UIJ57422.1 response regulator transcription factor [Amycolatopsis acidiphila]GHG84324.1 DNA-binding response regulator [Amycolatopsis acidiphila]
MTEDNTITLVVVDDQATVREALAVMLDLADDVTVVATATNGAEAVAAVQRHHPDVLLMDLNMPVMGGVEATGRIHDAEPDTTILVLTTFDDDESILAALRAGASGYLTKEANRTTILHAVRTAAQGQTVLAPEVQHRLLALATRPAPAAPPKDDGIDLTAREREILGLIGEGLRNPEIAAKLVISEATVKTHINNLFAKAGFHSRADAVRYALRNPLSGAKFQR